MEQAVLGRSGMWVSRLCLGTMMFGKMGNHDHAECERMIHSAFDAGVTFIDTSDTYSWGEAEEIVGRALKGRRDDVVLATKFGNPMGETMNHRGGSRRWIMREVEASLRRLGTDHIDLYQFHRFDPHTDLEETIGALTDLVRQGKIRSFGCSMFPADRIVEAHAISERMGFGRLCCDQSWYSIFSREIERDVLPACRRYGMGEIVFSPLDNGFLTGRYRARDDLDGNNRISYFARRLQGVFDPDDPLYRTKFAALARLDTIADDAGLTLIELAIGFILANADVTAAIIGPRTPAQLESLLAAGNTRLSHDVLDAIDAAVPPGSLYNVRLDKVSVRRR